MKTSDMKSGAKDGRDNDLKGLARNKSQNLKSKIK